ncbi:MAG TPA: ribosome maturation factor RimP [Alphaproteobacteria bacterium]|nr:ribosome maturation factor RimP [Alphaproteobacteria bacterium]HAJ48617.1 ribosome maturation factor RimP [Alphaproteobacteria bacterium]
MVKRHDELESLIAPIAAALGFELIRVRMSGGQRPTLQIMAERPDHTMNVDDCAALSRAISEAFEAEDPIDGEYVLEVSSPGIDRPLTRRKDYDAFAGNLARIELTAPLDGRKRFKGTLRGLRGNDVLVGVEGAKGEPEALLAIPYVLISEARLVLTDALIEADLKRRKAASAELAKPGH